jgi:hypothetical protein
MANTTFTGPVRSENGFIDVTKNADTGAFTTNFTLGSSGLLATPVALSDANTTLSDTVHGGRTLIIPNLAAEKTYTLPSPVAGLSFKFIYGGAAADAQNSIISTGADANFFIGGVSHLDTNADNVAVYANGSSNSKLTLTQQGVMEINVLAKDATNWYIWGYMTGAAAPTFADQ